jgi:hypothetical protein
MVGRIRGRKNAGHTSLNIVNPRNQNTNQSLLQNRHYQNHLHHPKRFGERKHENNDFSIGTARLGL